ncbi:MAG: NAD(P)-binding protein [Bacteroidales bacterium]|nr:NAD(P)-binding protein [Bacteroidales bacterium]
MSDKIRIAIIGAGLSGLTIAQELKSLCDVDLYEKESVPGGLVRCKRVNGSLFHICGGHVFNSKRTDVLNWFWQHFNQSDFHKSERNSVIVLENGLHVPYPIEDHISHFDEDTQRIIINDLLSLQSNKNDSANFDEYLRNSFGERLYEIYFRPYNEKVWGRSLNDIPLSWLQGKMPQSTISDILFNNINRINERQFVHSTFWYENKNGSQFIADTLSSDINVYYNSDIDDIIYRSGKWIILGKEYDKVVFTGNVKTLPYIMKGIDLSGYVDDLNNLTSHGTTSVFCEIDNNQYSWIYLPAKEYKCHRIICTGNFSNTNNMCDRSTGTVEFTGFVSKEEILTNLSLSPYHPKYLDHHYSEYSYPIQTVGTRSLIDGLKKYLMGYGCYLTGRFAEWEYYNMDAAVGAALDLSKMLNIDY